MLFLNEREVASLLPIGDVLTTLESAFRAQAAGRIRMPVRTMATTDDGILGAMPAAIAGEPAGLGAKLVTFFPGNAATGIHTHQALVALFDHRSGRPLAIMDGRLITEIRTAATSALATRALARPDARIVAILGTGVQARAHVDALAEVMDIDELRVWGRTPTKAAALADLARKRGMHARVAATPTAACSGAGVVCTVTSAHDPILAALDVEPGTHVNAVGMGGPTARELPGDLMERATIVVDSLDGALTESANIILAIREGRLPAKPALTLLCDVIAGKTAGRRRSDEITIFDSLGIAIEDVACARLIYDRASAGGIGTSIEL
jgi:ornithine cyclodeaminase/alanine dehydrogenase-like protein (mu-crystallin family)